MIFSLYSLFYFLLFFLLSYASTSATFITEFTSASHLPLNPNYFHQIRAVLLRYPEDPADTETRESVLELLNSFQRVARNLAVLFSHSPNPKRSFDEIVPLAYLEKLTHKFVQIYDKTLPEPSRLAFTENFTISTTLKELLLSNNCAQVQNIFDPQRSYELFDRLFKRDWSLLVPVEGNNFLGPEKYCRSREAGQFKLFALSTVEDEIVNRIIEIHAVDIEKRFKKLKTDESVPKEVRNVWKTMDPRLAKHLIVLSVGQQELFPKLPHFYLYMDILQSIRIAAKPKDGKGSVKFVNDRYCMTSNDPLNPELITISNGAETEGNELSESVKLSQQNQQNYQLLPQHLTNLSPLHFDIFFNYIKSARTAKIFDSPAFQYLADHLLNVPKFEWVRGAEGRVLPVEFEDEESKGEVVSELSRLIELSLNAKKQSRAVTISVLLTRFLSRHSNSQHLANLYNLIASYINEEPSTNTAISRLHFALYHICFAVKAADEKDFLERIQVNAKNRQSLKEFHWAQAKRNYPFVGNGVSDDQFNYSMAIEAETGEIELVVADPERQPSFNALKLIEGLWKSKSKQKPTFTGEFNEFLLTNVQVVSSEGSHFMVEKLEESNGQFKVFLITAEQAEKIISNPSIPSNSCSIWICNLSGKIKWSSTVPNSTQNILILLPQVKELVFDVLLLNGSLPQILANPILYEIYREKWLKTRGAEKAKFLLKRLKDMGKDEIVFEESDEELIYLKNLAEGELSAISEIEEVGEAEGETSETEEAEAQAEQAESRQTQQTRKGRHLYVVAAVLASALGVSFLIYKCNSSESKQKDTETEDYTDSETEADSDNYSIVDNYSINCNKYPPTPTPPPVETLKYFINPNLKQ